jgi:glucose-6-phosphate isomerase
MPSLPPLHELPAWAALARHQGECAATTLAALFAADPDRGRRYRFEAAGLLVDLAKTHLTPATLGRLGDLARATGVEAWRDRMFAGEPINESEGRAVLHVALRDRSGRSYRVDGEEVGPRIDAALAQMATLVDEVHGCKRRGAGGRPFENVLHLGIGGSELGPALLVEALAAHHTGGLGLHFVANVDGHALAPRLAALDPATTLVLVASKTFSTEETRKNAETAAAWLRHGGGTVERQMVAITARPDAARAFGLAPDNILPLWDWVGGRTSLWSAVGLPIALAVGTANFRALLAGAARLDEHFRTAPFEFNVPMLLGLLEVWYTDFWGAGAHAVVPYDERLRRLPAYLQQLEMESNGKAARRDGSPVGVATAPIVFGEPGTNGQHAFFQLLHQSERLIPVDVLLVARPDHDLPGHHDALLANGLAQTQALAFGQSDAVTHQALTAAGRSAEDIARLLPQRRFPGNRPATTILLDRLDPASLGALLALYEHKVFVAGAVWGLNSYDQWGVELGKVLARRLAPAFEGDTPPPDLDSSTAGLLAELLARR